MAKLIQTRFVWLKNFICASLHETKIQFNIRLQISLEWISKAFKHKARNI